MTTQVYDKQYLVFGCGNTLFGNDGFGPEVVDELKANPTLPDSVLVLDAGTGIRDLVFDLLLVETPPTMVIVIDAVTVEGRRTGDGRAGCAPKEEESHRRRDSYRSPKPVAYG